MTFLKMLPPEILTLVLLASRAYSIPYPQLPQVHNGTTPSATQTASITTIPAWAHVESTQTGWDGEPTRTDSGDGETIDCATRTCQPFVIIVQPSATGWETIDSEPQSTSQWVFHTTPENNVIVTDVPTIIEIHTSVVPTAGDSQLNKEPNGQGTHTQGGGGGVPNLPQPTEGGDLLTDIISHIAQPGTQPTQPAYPTGSSHHDDPQQMQQITPGVTVASGAQPTVVIGQSITVGPATLTLTPGLSTTVGTGPSATYIGITTNTAGQTLITIISSGTAVTATVTNAPATVTLPKTGFEASITDAARPGGRDSSSARGAAATTSSKGGAVDIVGEIDWWLSIAVGLLGFGIAL